LTTGSHAVSLRRNILFDDAVSDGLVGHDHGLASNHASFNNTCVVATSLTEVSGSLVFL
jgi:hypothetical protein